MNKTMVLNIAKSAGLVSQSNGKDWIEAHEVGEEFYVFAAALMKIQQESFCAELRKLHDFYSLQADQSGLVIRGQ